MRLLPFLVALKLSFLLGLVGAADEPKNGGSCTRYSLYNCATEDELDVAEAAALDKRDVGVLLDPRSVDFSHADQDTGFNISSLVRSSDFQDLSGVELHEKVSEVLSALGVGSSGENEVLKRFELQTRASGKSQYDLCLGSGKMTYTCPAYGTGQKLYDNEDWSDCNNFKLSPPKDGSTLPQAGRKHIDEHVLEKFILKQFAVDVLEREDSSETNANNNAQNLCRYLHQYWNLGWGNHLNVVNGHWAWDVIGDAWPHDDDAGAKEIVRIDSKINQVKTNVRSPPTHGCEFRMWAKANVSSETLLDKWVKDIALVGKAVAKLKLGVLLAKYLDHEDINKTYYRQAKRVSEAFATVEDQLVINYKDEQPPYVKQNLDQKWMAWIEKHTDERNTKLSQWMTKWAKVIKTHVKNGEEQKGGVKGMDADRQGLHHRMVAIVREIESMNEVDPMTGGLRKALFKNPFKPGAAPPDSPPPSP
ncbi:glycosyl hydrolase family 18 [Colletotrichum musicola]|uniref:Glycosyl hydrolase family 18 n=1 Tax=Colletotrichum musicola TaxID=2175873 RepID=A0A8H6NCG2_9PEZI|nr:glycosyl hydrolase family 18 [Colletotrichum musicola]